MPHAPGNGAILGVVSEDGIAKSGSPVDLYDRSTGALVQRQYTRDDGGFAFTGLNVSTADYRVVAQDEDAPYKEALVRDRITPVPGYRGATYYNNWLRLAQLNRAIGIYTGEPSPEGKLIPACSTAGPPLVVAGGAPADMTGLVPTTGLSLTPGAPQWPSVRLINQKLLVPLRPQDKKPSTLAYPEAAVPTALSLETVFDFASVQASGAAARWALGKSYSDNTSITRFTAGNYSMAGARNTLALVYRATRVLDVYINISGDSTYVNYLGTKLASFDLSAVAQGPHHVVVTATWGTAITLYLDGVLFGSASLAGQPTTSPSLNTDHPRSAWMAVLNGATVDSGNVAESAGVSVTQGPMAGYPVALSAQTVADLYAALMTGDVRPLVTGYARELYADTPVFYARLNEAPVALGVPGVTEFTRPEDNFLGTYYGSGLLFNQPTPITGGSGMAFGGAAAVRFPAIGQGFSNRIGYTLSWVGRPLVDKPKAAETMLAITASASTTWAFFFLQRATTGLLTLTQATTSGNEALTLTGVPYSDTATAHVYALVVDKTASTVTLYVDGAVAYASNVSGDFLSHAYDTNANVSYALHVGGMVNTNGAITNAHAGLLSELALFGKPLTAVQIANHYAARDVI